MKFETQSGCKLLSISLCDEREYLGLSLSPQQKLWCRDQDQDRRHIWSDKEADWPSENATAMLCGRSVFNLSSAVEEKTVTEDELRVEEVIARINTNVSLLERCNR